MIKEKFFIKTSDAETAEALRNLGYHELDSQGKFFVFINDGLVAFNEHKNVIYTNILNA